MKGGRGLNKATDEEEMWTLLQGQSITGEDDAAITTRFFKIMMPRFKDKMIFPPAFCRKIEEEKHLERAILKSRKGRYEIGVSRNSNQVYLEAGWARFVGEHGLSLGDVVVFEHTEKLQFYVGVFGSNACEEQYLPINDHHQTETPAARAIHRGRSNRNLGAVEIKSFQVIMTKYTLFRKARVTIPMEFAKVNNLEQKETASLNVGGRRWEVGIWSSKSGRLRTLIVGGWRRFYESNELQVGDVCVFKLIPTATSSSSPTNVSFDVQIDRATSR